MADGVMRVHALVFLIWAGSVAAADLGDPTRPAPGFNLQAESEEAPREAPLVVNTLFLMGTRPYALVDGQVVRVGDRLEAGRVVKINEHGVWLKTPTGSRQLELLPDVQKTPTGRDRKKVDKR